MKEFRFDRMIFYQAQADIASSAGTGNSINSSEKKSTEIKVKTPPPTTQQKPKVVPAQSGLGGDRWNRDVVMPTPGVDD